VDWINMAQVRDRWRAVVNPVLNLLVPQSAENFLMSPETDSFSRNVAHVFNSIMQ
jgi:hypothetical protein